MAKYTTQQIVAQFIKVHKDTYDYSQVNYIHSQTKVKIICKVHGIFEQLIGMHRQGQGCAKCIYDEKRSSLSDVIDKFKTEHGDKYDYSFVNYANVDTKVKILCKVHGVFEQTPYHHASGNGCPKCVGKNKTQEDMIELFIQAHGSRYDYSKVEFSRANDKVEIICSEHGSFYQIPINHASGKGCIKCSNTYQYNTSEIIEKFITVHGDTYNYDLIDYKNSHEKIKIVCKEHGVFTQTSGSHLAGNGCSQCAGNYQYDNDLIIEEFKKVHGDIYNYSEVSYSGIFQPVEIICKTHGLFSQVAKVHKSGSGCPDCAITIGHTKNNYVDYCNKTDGKTHLYLIKCKGNSELFYKVGIAKRGAKDRFNSKGKLPYDFEIIKQTYGAASFVWDLEKSVHSMMTNIRYKPKLRFNGDSECFSEAPDHIIKLFDELNNSEQFIFLI